MLTKDGKWTGHDWKNVEARIKVVNGNVFGIDSATQRLISSAYPLPGEPVVDFANPSKNSENVQRVLRVLSKGAWKYLFPIAKDAYTYENFVKAIAKFPMICNEKASSVSLSIDDVCKKELATMFAHFAQETGANSPNGIQGIKEPWRQAFYYLSEDACSHGESNPQCDYKLCTGWAGAAYKCVDGQKYFGRGAF